MIGRLSGRVALVTGGSQGIGEAIVRLFAAEGAAVAFCARTQSKGRRVEEDVRKAGGEVTYYHADISIEGDVERLITATVARYRSIDIVVNNAAVIEYGRVEELGLETWQRIFNANATGTFLVCKYAAKHLCASGKGCIINVASIFGLRGSPGAAAYSASKAAVLSLTRTLAIELAPSGVRVNALCPGDTETPMASVARHEQAPLPDDGRSSKFASRTPLGRRGSAADQARCALFLASDESSFVTGHSLIVDGGRLLD